MTRGHGQVRRSQVIMTWGPGALIDLPVDAAIMGGLDTWPKTADLEEIIDPRLTGKIVVLTGIGTPKLYAPPREATAPGQPNPGVGAWPFPQTMLVREPGDSDGSGRSRRIVRRKALDEKQRYEGNRVLPIRFVAACPRGHIEDINWYRFVHGPEDNCRRQLWLDERGTGGDLVDLTIRCECGKRCGMHEAADLELKPLGSCRGSRPWLGRDNREDCGLPVRLLIRTASNAYFPQILSTLSLPDQRSAVQDAVLAVWDVVQEVEDGQALQPLRQHVPKVRARLEGISEDDVLRAIHRIRGGGGDTRPVKEAEIEALLAAPEGFGDDVPIDPDYHARRLPDRIWRHSSGSDGIATVVQLHRLREVLALLGFTRFEAITPDINGDYDGDVERAAISDEPTWFPAVENRGEGIFLSLDPEAVGTWLARDAVQARLRELASGHQRWAQQRNPERPFPGGPYVLLHTLAHLLMQSMAMRCGYPATSIRERIYALRDPHRYGLLVYTASPDAEGTLGGLVQQGRHIEAHLTAALRSGGLCSNDPVCAQHTPDSDMEARWLHGAACHGCSLVAETSCEMRNDYLDRALVVPTLAVRDAAFFGSAP